MTQEANKEFLDNISFGDGEPAPEKEPAGEKAPEITEELKPAAEAKVEADPKPADDTEARAREMGWVPKEEFRGDPAKHIDAKNFVERGEKLLPIAQERLRKMEETNKGLRTDIGKMQKSLEDYTKYHKEDRERIIRREKENYEQKIADLRAQQRQAVVDQDPEAYDVLETQKTQLEEDHRKEEVARTTDAGKETTDTVPEALTEWAKSNQWFGTDMEATQYAQAVSSLVLNRNPNLKDGTTEFFDAVKAEVKLRYPQKFSNPRRDDHQGPEGGGNLGPTGGTNTFADLPAEAKAACIDLEKAGMDRKQYVAEYFGEDAIAIT
jgi:hypothetical protein